jgi:DNA-binding transcriptional ArsR family regulator
VTFDEISEEEQVVSEAIIKALNHKVRRALLLELYKYGWAGYSELSKTLNIKAGGFYHHMKLLEESGLVKQLEDKQYEITPQGAQASEFIRSNFAPLEDNPALKLLDIYNPISNIIDSFPKITIAIQMILLGLGMVWLAIEHQTSIIGFFILLEEETVLSLLYSIVLTLIGLIGIYLYYIIFFSRLFNKMYFTAHLLLPQSIFVFLVALLSFTPSLTIYQSIPTIIGVLFTLIYQLFSVTYYLHISQKIRIRILGRVLFALLIQQYYYLLVLFLIG